MEWHHIFFYAYCVSVFAVPSAYFILVNNVAFFFSLPLFHLFREFIASGPPASKTVIHGLVTSFTYCFQLLQFLIYLLSILGWFPHKAEELIQNYPQGFCVFVCSVNVRPALIYILFLAFFDLLMTIKIEMFLNMNHERVLKTLNIAAVIAWALITAKHFISTGTVCQPRIAASYVSGIIGLNGTEKYFVDKTHDYSHFPVGLPLVFCATFFYILSCILKKIKTWNQSNSVARVQTRLPMYGDHHEITPSGEEDDQRECVNFCRPILSGNADVSWDHSRPGFRDRQRSGGKVLPISEPTHANIRRTRPNNRAPAYKENYIDKDLTVPVPPLTFVRSLSYADRALQDSGIIFGCHTVPFSQPQDHSPSQPLAAPCPPSQPPAAARPPSQSPASAGPPPPCPAAVGSQPHPAATFGPQPQPPFVFGPPCQPPAAAGPPCQPPAATGPPTQPPAAAGPPIQPPLPACPPIQPPEAVPPFQPPSDDDHRSMSEQFLSKSFIFLVVQMIIIIIFIFFGQKPNDIGREIQNRLARFLIWCLPLYWVVMVEDCYQLALRRTKAWLADSFGIYLD